MSMADLKTNSMRVLGNTIHKDSYYKRPLTENKPPPIKSRNEIVQYQNNNHYKMQLRI